LNSQQHLKNNYFQTKYLEFIEKHKRINPRKFSLPWRIR